MTTLALFFLPAIVMLLVCGGRLEIGFLAAIGLDQWLAGAFLTRHLHPRLLEVCVLGTAALLSGYALARRRAPVTTSRQGGTGRFRGILGPLSVLTVVLVVVHFVRGGVPLLSGSVETTRFQLSASGLLGIPSRAYLFGLPIIVLAYATLKNRTRAERRMLLLMSAVFVASRILGGVKSGLLEVTFIGLIALVATTRARAFVLSRVVLQRALIGVAAVIFAGYLSTQYQTIHARSVSDAATYLSKRATTGTVSAGAYAVDGPGLPGQKPYMVRDFLYYGNKYGGGIPAGLGLFTPPEYTTSRLISSGIGGFSPSTNSYVTPVAIGFAPSLFLDWGWIGVAVGMAMAGFILRRIQWRLMDSSGLAAGIWGVLALGGVYVITNGGLAYYSLNIVATSLLYLTAAVVLSLLVPTRRPERSRLVPSTVRADR